MLPNPLKFLWNLYRSNNGKYYIGSSIVNELFDGIDDLSQQNYTFSISGNVNSGTLSIQAKSKTSNCTLTMNEKKELKKSNCWY